MFPLRTFAENSKVSEDGWAARERGPAFFLHSFSESAEVTDGSSDGRSLCEVLAVEWPDLDRMHTHTASISLPSKHSHLTHTPAWEAAALPLVTQSAVTGHSGR